VLWTVCSGQRIWSGHEPYDISPLPFPLQFIHNHDHDSITVFLFAAGAIVCSALAILSCDFFRLIAISGDGTIPMDMRAISNVGIFSYKLRVDENGTCRLYDDNGDSMFQPNNWMGAMWSMAQYASLIAPALGVLASLLVLAELLLGKFCGSFLLPALLYLFACASQGMTFFMYNEEDVCFRLHAAETESNIIILNSCQLSFGAFLSIAAGFCYYACSILLCCLPLPNSHLFISFCSGRTSKREGSNSGNANSGKALTNTESSSEADAENPS
jgi:hypothetical protein